MSRERVFKDTADGICQQSSCNKPVRQNGFQSRADLHGKSAKLKILSVARAVYYRPFKKNRSNLELETTQESGNGRKEISFQEWLFYRGSSPISCTGICMKLSKSTIECEGSR